MLLQCEPLHSGPDHSRSSLCRGSCWLQDSIWVSEGPGQAARGATGTPKCSLTPPAGVRACAHSGAPQPCAWWGTHCASLALFGRGFQGEECRAGPTTTLVLPRTGQEQKQVCHCHTVARCMAISAKAGHAAVPGQERSEAQPCLSTLTLSFDLLAAFTLMTGSPLDLSITTVRSVPLLPA